MKVRYQNATTSKWIYTAENSIQVGSEYQVAVSFGANGFRVYLNGELQGSHSNFTHGIDANLNNLAIGASIWGRSASNPTYNRDHFDGVIEDFTVYGAQLTDDQIRALYG